MKDKLVEGDTIFVTDFDSAIFIYGLKNKFKIKFIFDIADFIETFDSTWPKILRFIIRKLYVPIYKVSDYIILPDKNRLINIPEKFHHKVKYINNAPVIKNTESLETAKINNDKLNIIYYGGLSDDRGIRLLLELSNNFPNIQVHIAGWGQLESTIKNYSNVIYHGMLEESNILRLLSSMDYSFIVYDPKHEHNQIASPNKFFEAIQLQVPMIVCEGTSIDKEILRLGIGEVIQYDYQSLANLIINISRTKPHYSFNQKMKTDFSWKSSVKTIKEIF